MFAGQLNSANGAIQNIGLSYSVELHRDGKIYKVDNRFPFRSGDKIRFHVKPNVDGYMYILLDDQHGGTPMVMFPRPGDDDNAVTKGKSLMIPQNGVLTFDEHAGIESLKLVLSTKSLERKPSEMARSVVITAKPQPEQLPADFLIDFASLDPEQLVPISNNDKLDQAQQTSLNSDAAQTLVSTTTDKPLVVDLLLRHNAKDGTPPIIATVNRHSASGPAAVLGTPHDTRGSSGIESHTPAATLAALSGSSPVQDKWAVVIGISDFKNPRWNLKYPQKDAKDFAQFLVNKCNFAQDHVRVLTNASATRERILTDIGSNWLPRNAKPNDLVCIYFATHGTSSALDVARRNFLMAYDTDPANPFATGIELQDLAKNIVRRLESRRVVLILDTCHSGAAEVGAKSMDGKNKFDLKEFLQGTGHLVIASAAANQTAHDSARYKNGIFTFHLMEGLAKYPRLSEAFNYTKIRVQEEATIDYKEPQTPVLKDAEWRGIELKLAVPPLAPRKPIVN